MLEKLFLNHIIYSTDDANTHIEPVVLQHLKFARLGGSPSSQSPNSLPYIEVDLLPYLSLPPTGQCDIRIGPMGVGFPHGMNYLLTLIHAWEIISGPGGSFGGGSGFTHAMFSIEESPNTFTGQLQSWTAGWGGSIWVCPEDMVLDSQSWLTPDWETTTTDEDPGVGEAVDDEFQAQLSRLGHYLDPLRWSPSPLAAVEILILCGFGYTTNKGKYLQYLRECFRGMNRVHKFQVDKTNPGMVAHLLHPFQAESGGTVLLFPLLQLLSFSNCTPVKLPQLLEAMKKRAGLGNVLEMALVDNEKVDLSELSDIQERT